MILSDAVDESLVYWFIDQDQAAIMHSY